MSDVLVTVVPSAQQTIVVTPPPMQQVSVTQAGRVNLVSTSTERVDVQQLGIVGPPGPPGEDVGLDIDQYGRVVLDGGPPNLTNGA